MLLLLCGVVIKSSAQDVIWLETFDEAYGSTSGTASGTRATNWSTSGSDPGGAINDGIYSSGGKLSGLYTSAHNLEYFITGAIDISGYESVQISIDVSEDSGNNLEKDDAIEFQYSIDAAEWKRFDTNGYQTKNFNDFTALQFGLLGSGLVIRVHMVSNDYGEYHYIDNVKVTGTPISPPDVSLSIDNSSISEAGGAATITASLDHVSSDPVTAYINYGGTASNSADYNNGGQYSISIPAGSLSSSITINTVEDCAVEGDKSIIVSISNVTNGVEDGEQQVTTTIIDNDVYPVITLSASALSINEDGGLSTITVDFSNTFCQDVTVWLSFGSGTASNGTDYSYSSNSVIVPAGSHSGTITVSSINDYLVEGNETLQVGLSSTNISGISTTVTPLDLVFVDDDSYSILVSPTSGLETTEGGGTATFSVVLKAITYNDVTISLSSSNTGEGTVSPSSLTFTPGNYYIPQNITVTGVDDIVDDGDISYTIVTSSAISDNSNYNGIDPDDVSIVNRDDETTGGGDAPIPTMLSGYCTYMPLTIQSSQSITNYQFSVQIPYDNRMNADFSDIRFSMEDGTILDYWIEGYTASSQATVWVKVPDVSTGNNFIYLFFGNSSAASASDISSTLSSGLLLNYYTYPGGASPSESTWTLQSVCDDANSPINYNWGSGQISFCGQTYSDHVVLRWTGWLEIPSGSNPTVRFQAGTDDGVRVYLDGNIVDDNWHDRGVSYDSFTYSYNKQVLPFQYDYYENSGGAAAYLRWDITGGTSYSTIAVGNYYHANYVPNAATITLGAPSVDKTDPVISNCPSQIIVQSNDGNSVAVSWTEPEVVDNCSAELSSDHASGSLFPVGTTLVTYTATDEAGNNATCQFDVVVMVTDTDKDGVPDAIDLDDDNDGIADCVEKGLEDFSVENNFIVSGDAKVVSSSEIKLTPEVNNQRGTAMYKNKIDFSISFNFSFDAYLGNNDGADGIAIVFHNDPSGSAAIGAAIGAAGEGMGASGIANGIVLELDTYYNSGQGDVTGDHGCIWESDNISNRLTSPIAVGELEDNAWHSVSVSWNGPSNTISYSVDGNLAGQYSGDIVTNYFSGSSAVYLGFTAATGGATNVHGIRFNDICGLPAIVDTDGDGNPDVLDLDSDNDGCNDVVEAGYTDPDSDGILGSGPVVVNSGGLVISGTDGYTVPADIDSNSIFDFQEAGPSISFIQQPLDVTDCAENSTSFSIIAKNADTYQWQVNSSGSWNDIPDVTGDVYTNQTTATLGISNLAGLGDNQYRCVVSRNGCFEVNSDPATLTVSQIQVSETISNESCLGQNDGGIDITVTGGIGNYSFAWSTSDGSGLVADAEDQSGLSPGTYAVEIADGNNCTKIASYNIEAAVDNDDPVISCPNDIVVNVYAGTCSAVVNYVSPVGTDNCSGSNTVQIAGLGSGATFPVGITTETYEVTDASGRKAQCSFTVTVIGNEAPRLSCPAATVTILANPESCSATYDWQTALNVQSCHSYTVDWTRSDGEVLDSEKFNFAVGTTVVDVSVTDDINGLETTCQITVFVDENPDELPTIVAPDDISVLCSDAIPSKLTIDDFNSTTLKDNCGYENTSFAVSDVTVTNGDGSQTITRTYSISDYAGNTASDQQIITVTNNLEVTASVTILPGCTGELLQITATVSGFGTPTYQWEKFDDSGWNAFAGDVTGDPLVFETSLATDADRYRLVVSEDGCSAASSGVVVNFNDLEEPEWINTGSEFITHLSGSVGSYSYATCSNGATGISILALSNMDVSDNCSSFENLSIQYAVDGGSLQDGDAGAYSFPVGTTSVHYEISDENSNTLTIDFDVVVNENPEQPDISTDGTIGADGSGYQPYQGETHNYSVTNEAGYSYTWEVRNASNTDITTTISATGQGTSEYSINWNAITMPGSYTVTLVKANTTTGCSVSSSVAVVVINSFNPKVRDFGDACHEVTGEIVMDFEVYLESGTRVAPEWDFSYNLFEVGVATPVSNGSVTVVGVDTKTVSITVNVGNGDEKNYRFEIYDGIDSLGNSDVNGIDNKDLVKIYARPSIQFGN